MDRDTERIQQSLRALRKQDATASVRFLCLISYLHFYIIPNILWTTDNRFRDHILRPLLYNDVSLELLLKPLLESAVIYRSTLAKAISIEPLAQNAVRALIETKTSEENDLLQFLTEDERSPVYWIKRAIELVNIAYLMPLQNNQTEYKVLNLHAIKCIQFGRWHHIDTADYQELQPSFTCQVLRHGVLHVPDAFYKSTSKP